MSRLFGVKTGTLDTFTSKGERVRWVPKGDLIFIGDPAEAKRLGLPRTVSANPPRDEAKADRRRTDKDKVRDSARLFIGCNVNDEPTWRVGEIYLMAYIARNAQNEGGGKGILPAFTMFGSVGAFPGRGAIIASERSAQLVFINFGQDSEEFFDDMQDLAAELAELLHQESVLVELQEFGKTFYADYIHADQKQWQDVGEVRAYLKKNSGIVEKKVFEME